MEELSAAAPPKSAAGRLAQVVLAATLTLGSLAYSVGLTRQLSLVISPELLFLAGVIAFLTMEGTRRTSGYSLIVITFVLVVWVLLGHLVPGQLRTHKVEPGNLAVYLNFDNNGLLGLVLEIACTIVIAFVLMGQLLARSGGSGFFNDFALGLMGRFRGGAAKISVVASSLFGSISGIAAASALAVGVVTIPLMKKSGIPARLAAAIEACAANGAQLMPPVMGAVAFVMADFLQVPYREVALAALLPSLLYYAALFIQCDLETARYGIGKVDRSEIPGMGPVLRTGWIFLAPFAAIVGAMFWMNWEPEPAAALASAIIIVLGLAIGYRGARMKLADIWSAIIETGIGVCEIVVISAIGGYVLGLFQIGGLSFALTAYLVTLGAQNLLALLIICAVTNIVLGLGLPTLAVYVMLAILVAPALVKVGVPAMAAHLFILYFGIMSLITPPIATAAFVAATIAKTDPMAAGWTAMRFGWASYIVPFLFVYSPALIMRGSALEIGLVMILSIAGIWFVCAAFTGYAMRVMGLPMRVAFGVAGLLLLMPFQASAVTAWVNVLGAGLGVALLIYEFKARGKATAWGGP